MITDRVVGRGGSGAVYVAIHKESKRQLACKVIEYETRRMPLGDMTSASQNNADFVSSISKALGSGERAALSNTSSIVGSYRFREFDILKDLDHVWLSLYLNDFLVNIRLAQHHSFAESILERQYIVCVTVASKCLTTAYRG